MVEDRDPVDPALDTLFVLIAELMKTGKLGASSIDSMVRRLRMADLEEVADRLEVLHYSNELDSPGSFRKGFHLIEGGQPDGGNSDD